MIGRDFHRRTRFGERLQSRRDVLKAAALTSVAGFTAAGVTTGAGSSQFGQSREMAIQATATEDTLATQLPEPDGTEEGIVDPAAVLMAPVPQLVQLGGQVNDGIKVISGTEGIVEGLFLTAEQLASLPPSFDSMARLQMYAFHSDDPAIYTLNAVWKILLFDEAAGAKSFIKALDKPWAGGNIVPDEEIEVSGLNLQWYEVPDRYQPNLTNRVWHLSFIANQTWVFEGVISSVLPEIDISWINELAAAPKRASRLFRDRPFLGDFVIPPDENQALVIPKIWDGEIVPIVDADPADAEYDAIFGGSADYLFSMPLQTTDEAATPVFTNQCSLWFTASLNEAKFYWGQVETMYRDLDSRTGIRRRWIEWDLEQLLEEYGGVLDSEFLISSGDATYGGVDQLILDGDKVHNTTILPNVEIPEDTFESVVGSDAFSGGYRQLSGFNEWRQVVRNSEEPRWFGFTSGLVSPDSSD